MPIKLKNETKIIDKNLYVNNEKNNLKMDINGMEKPQIIIREGQNFTIVKETKNKNDEKNIGVIKTKNIDGLEIDVRTDINEFLKYKKIIGGEYNNILKINYYKKYLKYKIKYLNLKESST
jgi:hypothetical protein